MSAHLVAVALSLSLASTALAQSLPDRILVGYWHNWRSSPNSLKLTAIPKAYDVINVAFATPTKVGGATMQFTPDPGLYATNALFIADVRALQKAGKKVLISVGGANGVVHVQSATDATSFANSMVTIIKTYGFDGMDIDLEGSSLMLQAGDTDFRKPKSPRIVHFISGVQQLVKTLGSSIILTAAPETAFVQGGYVAYAGIWGAYLPVLHALRSQLTYIHVQHYNTGGMYGRDGKAYTPATEDFHVAMADMLLAGFVVDRWRINIPFPPFRPDQVAIGLPATTKAGGGHTAAKVVHGALDRLYLGAASTSNGKYQLAKASGYPKFRGLMTWSVNWDVSNNEAFSKAHRAYLDTVFLRSDTAQIREGIGGTATFTLRAGVGNANRFYVLVPGVSGTTPGTKLPGSSTVLPLNVDHISPLIVTPGFGSVFQGFYGNLDARGEATAKLNLPALPGSAGLTFYLAYALAGPWNFASTPARVRLVK